ncbi:MAG TPA: hypothetical protein VGV85_14135 [Longimicrobiaceae bacterium]|nr:hypothetical protein [Longimicrobiaceae bacterium]
MNEPDTVHVPVEHVVAEDDAGVVAVEVVGSLGHAEFPDLCVECGTAADRTIPITKLYYHHGHDNPSYYFTAGVAAPACGGCVQAHQRELSPIAPEAKRRLLRGWALAALPYVVPMGVIFWLLTRFVPLLAEAVREGTEPIEMAVWGAVCAFFGLLGFMFWGRVMKPGRKMIVTPADTPAYVKVERGPLGGWFIAPTDPTSLMRSVDFTDDISELFEPERHRFTFRNYEVAARFGELNAHREWNPASPRAQFAAMGRKAVIAAVVLFVVWTLVEEFLF